MMAREVWKRSTWPHVWIGDNGHQVIGSESNSEENVSLEMELVSQGKYERRARHLDAFGRPSRLFIELRACVSSLIAVNQKTNKWPHPHFLV
jgi:hypothetical protein